MNIIIKGTEQEIKFTFNSFRYMQDFSVSDISLIDDKPFTMIPMTEILLLGALNCEPSKQYTKADVLTFLEEYIEEKPIAELLESLMDALQESSFFKSLQRKPTSKKKTK
jgi:hypothetical protein